MPTKQARNKNMFNPNISVKAKNGGGGRTRTHNTRF